MHVIEKRCRRMMSRKIVPDHDDFPTVITMNFVQSINTFFRIQAMRNQIETKSDVLSFQSDSQEAEPRRRTCLRSLDKS